MPICGDDVAGRIFAVVYTLRVCKAGAGRARAPARQGAGARVASKDEPTRQAAVPLPISRLWPFLGLWTMHVWIYWANTASVWGMASDVPWRSLLYGVMTLAMLGAAMVHWNADPAHEGGRADPAMTVLMCAVTVSAQVRSWAGLGDAAVGQAWGWANVALAGLVMAWGYLRWAAVYARLPIRGAVGCLFASYLLGSSLKIVFDAAPGALGSAMALALPIVSLVCTRRAKACEWPEQGARQPEVLYRKDSLSMLTRLAVCVGVFCIVRVMVSTLMARSGNYLLTRTVSHLVEIAFAACALTLVFRKGRTLDFPQLWRFVFLFLGATIVVGCASQETGVSLGIGPHLFSDVGTSLIVMLLWLLLADIAHHSDLHPYVVFGAGWSLYVGTNCAGPLVAHALGLTEMTSFIGLVLTFALGISMAFCLETRDPDVQRIFADLRTKVDPEEFASIDERCEGLACQYGLTGREVDVLKLLAKGRSKNYIAETLYISENTVRGHSRRLYAKLGVHTRDELQALLGCD